MPSTNNYKGLLLIIVIGLCTVAVGHILDFLLKKSEVKKLHNYLLNLSIKLTNVPINEWMFGIAKDFIEFFLERHESLKEFFVEHFEKYYEGLPGFKNKKLSVRDDKERMRNRTAVAGAFLIFYIIIYADMFIKGTFEAIQPNTIFFFVFIITFFLFALFPIYLFLDNCYSKRGEDIPKWFFLLLTSCFISVVYSSFLVNASLYLFSLSPSDNSYWLHKSGEIILWKNVLTLIFLNFPFDFLTILITYSLFVLYTEKRFPLFLVAIVDLLSSALLTIFLYACLLCIDNNWDFTAFLSASIEAVFWFYDVLHVLLFQTRDFLFGINNLTVPNLYLFPLIFSTFLPVTIYIAIILILLFCKLVLKFAIRVFSVIGEREESVFKQFAVLLAVVMTAFKVFYDYLTLP